MDAEKVIELDAIEGNLSDVLALVSGTLIETSLGFLVHDHQSLTASGKLLRSRLSFRLAEQLGLPELYQCIVRACPSCVTS